MSTTLADASVLARAPSYRREKRHPENHSWLTLAGLWRTIQLWIARPSQRAALRDLDRHLLSDIGLTRSQALSEAAKPFWRK